MKPIFNFNFIRPWNIVLTLAWLAGACGSRPPARQPSAERGKSLGRLAALADYLAADYPGAVSHGKILAADEYEEQRGLIKEVGALLAEVAPLATRVGGPAALAAEVRMLGRHVDERADEAVVAADCRAIHRRLIEDFGLVLAPLAPPSEERARTLFVTACAACHGENGDANTERARTLKPPPVSFRDPERMSRISPSLAFHALTFGVTNTAMASFDLLPASDRWSLAFFVVALRHRGGDLAAGEKIFRNARLPLATSASRLAELTDLELDQLLASSVPIARERQAAIDYLRVRAPFAPVSGAAFAEARRLLEEVARAADDLPRAKRLAVDAYLEGVEPHEAALRARDRALADRLERSFLELRRNIEAGARPEIIREQVARATLILDGVEERQGGERSIAFFAALAIALREGFEISLLIAALLAFVRKSGRGADTRFIHYGWLAAVPAGLMTWFIVGAALGGTRRELTEGVLTLVAAGMLLFVSHFVLGRLESRRWMKFLERRMLASGHQPGAAAWPLALLAFIAAYREAVEIVLFFRALALDMPAQGRSVALGALAGLAVLALLVAVMDQLGRRLNPRPVMLASSVLLTALAVALVGHGLRALQEGGYVHLTSLPLPAVPTIGLYPTAEGLAAQALVLALAVVPSWIERRRARRAA